MMSKLILNVILPPLSNCCSVKTFKVPLDLFYKNNYIFSFFLHMYAIFQIMPRSQNSHAIINAGFLFKFQQNSELIEKASIVYGGISKSFVHATKAEDMLVGKNPYSNEILQLILKNLAEELKPEENSPEPSPAYRKMLAICLYYKVFKIFSFLMKIYIL